MMAAEKDAGIAGMNKATEGCNGPGQHEQLRRREQAAIAIKQSGWTIYPIRREIPISFVPYRAELRYKKETRIYMDLC
jgi:hypothetical protein